MCGADDTPWMEDIDPPWLRALQRTHRGVRLGRALRLSELLVPIIIQQRVRFSEAAKSWARLVHALGEPAPGPSGLRLPPSAAALRSLRVCDYAALGLDAQRARTIRECALHLGKVDLAAETGLQAVRALLPKLPGVGVWTSELALGLGMGDADAVPLGDVHLPSDVVYAFERRRRGDDQEMLEILEHYRGHRFRVLRLVLLGGPRRPRGGPRLVPTPM